MAKTLYETCSQNHESSLIYNIGMDKCMEHPIIISCMAHGSKFQGTFRKSWRFDILTTCRSRNRTEGKTLSIGKNKFENQGYSI